MVSYILIILAAICNSIMDITTFHYSTSIFSKYNAQFWNPSISWTNKYIDHDVNKGMRKFFGLFDISVVFTDSWHLFKSLMIFALVGSVVCYTPLLGELLLKDVAITNSSMYILVRLIDFIIMGTLWNLTFSLFFNHIFVSTKKY